MSVITGCAPTTPPPTASPASTASVAPAPPLFEATAQPPAKLALDLDKVEISDAARARLASDRQQEQKYVAQLSASREQASIT
jgi:hypothetical protein